MEFIKHFSFVYPVVRLNPDEQETLWNSGSYDGRVWNANVCPSSLCVLVVIPSYLPPPFFAHALQ